MIIKANCERVFLVGYSYHLNLKLNVGRSAWDLVGCSTVRSELAVREGLMGFDEVLMASPDRQTGLLWIGISRLISRD